MRIGELAGRTGVDAQTIRYYERIGLLPEPERTESRYRVYGDGDEARLRFVKSARELGMTLAEVREILALRERAECPCGYVAGTLARHAEDIRRRIVELTRFEREIEGLLGRTREQPVGTSGEPGYCRIIEGRTIDPTAPQTLHGMPLPGSKVTA